MTACCVRCERCAGAGYVWPPPPPDAWLRCAVCRGLGEVWERGAPSYGCQITLADREPGEIVTLGNGQRGRILWHAPKKDRKVVPETTFVGLISDFDGVETHEPVPFPSCVGVASVAIERTGGDADDHLGDRSADPLDPMARRAAGGPLL